MTLKQIGFDVLNRREIARQQRLTREREDHFCFNFRIRYKACSHLPLSYRSSSASPAHEKQFNPRTWEPVKQRGRSVFNYLITRRFDSLWWFMGGYGVSTHVSVTFVFSDVTPELRYYGTKNVLQTCGEPQ